MAVQRTQPSTSDARHDVAIRPLLPRELGSASSLLAVAMRDNPLHARAFGTEPLRRQQRLQRFLVPLLAHVSDNGEVLGAWTQGGLVGVLGRLSPHRCRPSRMATVPLLASIMRANSPASVWRILRWLMAWRRNDPVAPHVHIGPLGVLPPWRRQGIARALMSQCLRHPDALGTVAWLETDLATNVAFYETLGFVVARREPVLGVANWFMCREPSAHAVAGP